jgi:hypothetical protein
MTTSREGREFSPEPSEVLRCVIEWLRGFHVDRERSKAADWAMVSLTVFAVIAAIVSAWFFQEQLVEARRSTDAAIHNFTVDERAWVELEPIKGTVKSPRTAKIGAGFSYPVYVRNVGKTVARDVRFRASRIGSQSSLTMGDNAQSLAWTQDKLLLGKVPTASDIPITIATPNVLAPNSVSPAPAILYGQERQPFPKDEWVSYLIGRVDYTDEFGIPHWLKFCFFVADAQGNLWNCKEGNDEDHNPEQMNRSEVGGRRSQNSLVRDIFIAIVTGLFASVIASFIYQMLISRRREKRLRRQFAGLAGEYQETGRDAGATPTGGTVKLTYFGGTKFKTEGITHNGVVYWHGEIFMMEEAGILGAGYYSHTTSDDTGIHEVIYNPALEHFNVSGQNTSHPDGRKFKMVWQRPAGTCF